MPWLCHENNRLNVNFLIHTFEIHFKSSHFFIFLYNNVFKFKKYSMRLSLIYSSSSGSHYLRKSSFQNVSERHVTCSLGEVHPDVTHFFGWQILFTLEWNTITFTPGRKKKIHLTYRFFQKRDFINSHYSRYITLMKIKNWVGKCYQETKNTWLHQPRRSISF